MLFEIVFFFKKNCWNVVNKKNSNEFLIKFLFLEIICVKILENKIKRDFFVFHLDKIWRK
jgi:hypothetical protein